MLSKNSFAALAGAAMLLVLWIPGSPATAHPDGFSLAVNFAADEPNPDGEVDPNDQRSDVTGPAGLLQTATWSNFDLLSGGAEYLDGDDAGVLTETVVTVTWASNNTWSSAGRGEENNTAPAGDDRNLMTGYLDTTDVSVTSVAVSDLDSAFDVSGTYAVYVYVNGGVIDRGGTYTIAGQSKSLVDSAPFDGTYVEGENFLVFDGLTAPDFTLTATPTTTALFRAPINAIEIVEGGIIERIIPLRAISKAVSEAECPPNGRGPLTVAIARPLEDGDDPGEEVGVIDTVAGPLTEADVSGAESASNVYDGLIRDWLLLGPYLQDTATVATPETPGEAIMRLDYLTDGLDVEEDSVQPEEGDAVNTDFLPGLAASVGLAVIDGTTPEGDPINPGGAPTWLAWRDADDAIDLIEIYGQVDSVMTYALAYVSVESDVAVDMCIASDDAVQVLVDGEEVWINNVTRGTGAVRECQDLVPYPLGDPVGTLEAGVHTVMLKVFQGGGGHGLRFGFKDAVTGEPAEGITICTNRDADLCRGYDSIGVAVSSSVTRQELADGISYTIDVIDGSFAFSGTAAGEPIEGDNAITLGCDTRVRNVVCVQSSSGGADVTWENHPTADPAVDISILVGGVEVATVPGDATSATVGGEDLQAGYNQICVVNSSGSPACCQIVKGGLGLADLVGGGDGTGTADPAVVGINIDTGALETAYLNADVLDTGDNPQAVDASAYVDSVFIISAAEMPLTSAGSAGPVFTFDALDVFNSYGHILKDVTHDIDKDITDIWAGGLSDWISCVAIHAAGGITFDLEALRDADHGELLDFSCFAGSDQCGTATINLYVIFSDAEEVVDSYSVLGVAANMGAEVEMVVPETALYLTLAVGASDGAIGCDHGVFANAMITTEGGVVPTDTFVRGDPDSSGVINITDGIRILSYLFTGGLPLECPDAGDTDNDGALTITDAIKVFGYLFLGQGEPAAPAPSNAAYVGADCGVDTEGSIGCAIRAVTCGGTGPAR